MTEDAESRVIAHTTAVVAGVATLGWFVWLVTAADPTGVVPALVVGSIALTLASVPASVVGVFLLDRQDHPWTTVSRAVALGLLAAVFVLTVGIAIFGVDGTTLLVATGLALSSLWIVVPLAVGAVDAAGRQHGMIGVLLAWPPSNLLAVALFLAPAEDGIDLATGNALALAEPLRSVVLVAVLAVLALGPSVLGRLVDRLIRVET